MLPNVITLGFKRSGIYPFNLKDISCVITKKSTLQDTSQSNMPQYSQYSDNTDDHILNLPDDQVEHLKGDIDRGYDQFIRCG